MLQALVQRAFAESAEVLMAFARESTPGIVEVARLTLLSLRRGGKVITFGNGGSAADAQHFAAELVNRFRIDRAPLAGLALTTDTSAITAIGNDLGFEHVFERQIRALAREGDVAVGITTSGGSSNVLRGLEVARDLGCTCVGLTGAEGSQLRDRCDIVFRVPSEVTPRIQECHVAWIHAVCECLDEMIAAGTGP